MEQQREIRFKGKRVEDGKWVEGSLLKVFDDAYIEYISQYGSLIQDKVDTNTICQFTNVKDRYGKEIWEHDMLQLTPHNSTPSELTFKLGTFMLDTDPLYFYTDYTSACSLVKIGNKFDEKK